MFLDYFTQGFGIENEMKAGVPNESSAHSNLLV